MDTPKIASGFPRSFSPATYPAHRRVILLMAVAALAVFTWHTLSPDFNLGRAILVSANAALASFIAWAISRELDPDRAWRAHLSQILLIPAAIAAGPLALLPSALVIGTSRYLTGITGLRWTKFDHLAISLGSLALMVSSQNPALGIVGTLTLFLAARAGIGMVSGRYALFCAAITGVYSLFFWEQPFAPLSPLGGLLMALLSALTLLRVLRLREVRTRSDHGAKRIEPERLRAAILIALALPVLSLWMGVAALVQFGPLLAALAATS